jgi:hypothetical protein
MQFKGFTQESQEQRYYYNADGVFIKSSSDTDMSAVDLPYIVKPKGWSSCDYTMVGEVLTHTPKTRTRTQR